MALESRNVKRKRDGGGNTGEEIVVGGRGSAADQLEHRISTISQSDSSNEEKVNGIVSAIAFTQARLETEQKQYGKTFTSAVVTAVFVLAGVTAEQLRGTLTKHEHKQNHIVLLSSDPVVSQILAALESVEEQLQKKGVALTDPKRREVKNAMVSMALSMAKNNQPQKKDSLPLRIKEAIKGGETKQIREVIDLTLADVVNTTGGMAKGVGSKSLSMSVFKLSGGLDKYNLSAPKNPDPPAQKKKIAAKQSTNVPNKRQASAAAAAVKKELDRQYYGKLVNTNDPAQLNYVMGIGNGKQLLALDGTKLAKMRSINSALAKATKNAEACLTAAEKEFNKRHGELKKQKKADDDMHKTLQDAAAAANSDPSNTLEVTLKVTYRLPVCLEERQGLQQALLAKTMDFIGVEKATIGAFSQTALPPFDFDEAKTKIAEVRDEKVAAARQELAEAEEEAATALKELGCGADDHNQDDDDDDNDEDQPPSKCSEKKATCLTDSLTH